MKGVAVAVVVTSTIDATLMGVLAAQILGLGVTAAVKPVLVGFRAALVVGIALAPIILLTPASSFSHFITIQLARGY
jgi:hypothetical protein